MNKMTIERAICFPVIAALVVLINAPAKCQQRPDVRGHTENYPVNMVRSWQSRRFLKSVQVVVLRDPSGEQEARFDLTHGATLISLRYHGHELLFGHSAGAKVGMFVFRRGSEEDLNGMSPYWSAFHPSQGGTSMGIPATTAGVACNGEKSMRAFAVMVDAGVDNSFQRDPLLAVWKGKLDNHFPPGYSTSYTIETDASWVPNPNGEPKYYLRLHQVVVNVRPGKPEPMQWFLEGTAPWSFQYKVQAPENCTVKTPGTSATDPVLMTGRYKDSTLTNGFAIVVPTATWATNNAYVLDNAEYVNLLYGSGVWAAPRHTFAVVLSHPFGGLSACSFNWYICAGSWSEARTFGKLVGNEARLKGDNSGD